MPMSAFPDASVPRAIRVIREIIEPIVRDRQPFGTTPTRASGASGYGWTGCAVRCPSICCRILRRLGSPYTRDGYEKVISASTEELVNAPHAAAERLVAPLLRGLDIASRYLPYKP